MQIIHNFGISPVQYYKNGRNNNFPSVDRCPFCNDLMIGNGFYTRYVITFSNKSYLLFIRRYRCQHCNHTVSILPSFLLSYFQRSLKSIFTSLEQYFYHKKYSLTKQQVYFYIRRFIDNIPGLVAFFRQFDLNLSLGDSSNKKAIKLIKMIKSSPTPTFSRRYYNHFNKDFMAL